MTLPKHLARLIDGLTYPALLVEHGKHGDDYHIATSRGGLMATFLAILKERMENGYISRPSVEPSYLRSGEVSTEQAEAMPEPYRTQALRTIQYNRSIRIEHRADVEAYDIAQKSVADSDGEAAFVVLWGRNDYEYERISIECPAVDGKKR